MSSADKENLNPVHITRHPDAQHPPRVSVIIPSRDGQRNGYVPRLLNSISRQSFTDYETILVTGVFPQGKAINLGVESASGALFLIMDDDSEVANPDTFAHLVSTLDDDPKIGMAGASILISPEASLFQRRAATQFPRLNTPEVDKVTDSDMACHGCCIIPRQVYELIGGEREDIIRGLDPDLRVRIRTTGYRVVLVPGAGIYHPLPDGWCLLLRMFFRNGYGSAYSRKFHPESVFETQETLESMHFRPETSFFYRLIRFPFRLIHAAFHMKWMRFMAYIAYGFGYVWGMFTANSGAVKSG